MIRKAVTMFVMIAVALAIWKSIPHESPSSIMDWAREKSDSVEKLVAPVTDDIKKRFPEPSANPSKDSGKESSSKNGDDEKSSKNGDSRP